MGSFPRKYGPEQKAAIIWAQLDRTPRLTASKAVEAAGNGTLNHSLRPFSMPTTTAQSFAYQEKVKRRKRQRIDRGEDVSGYDKMVKQLARSFGKAHVVAGHAAGQSDASALNEDIEQASK